VSGRWPRAAAIALTLSAPIAAFFLYVRHGLGYSFADYAPAWPNDEVFYYHQVLTFVKHGFSGGYYSMLEQPAPASFIHFGPHGPLFPVLQGMLGKVFGWGYASGPLYNIVFFTLGLGAFLWLVRPKPWTTLLLCMCVLTFWPFYWFTPTNLQESLHSAFAMAFAGGFHLLLEDKPLARRRSFRVSFVVLLCVASLTRISWALLMPPLVFLIMKRGSWRRLLAIAAVSAASVLALMYVVRWLCAPYRLYATAFLMNKVIAGEAAWQTIANHARENLVALGALGFKATPLDLPTVVQVVPLVLVMGVMAVAQRVRKQPVRDELFHGYNLLAIVGTTIPFYFIGNGGASRVFSIQLLLTTFMLVASERPRLMAVAGALAVANLMVAPSCWAALAEYHKPHFTSKAAITRFHDQVRGEMVFLPNSNAWCNTVLLSNPYPPQHAGIPAGIGFGYFLDPSQMTGPIKSRYVIALPAQVMALRFNYKLAAQLPGYGGAALYLNQDARCP
jgi:hypothetical protein